MMTILATKLYIPPPRPNVIPRPRLLERLNKGLDCKLTLITAPAGFGKTTLVSNWIASLEQVQTEVSSERTVDVAWLSLDEKDSDLPRFLNYLTAALQAVSENIGKRMSGLLHAPHLPPIELILETLLNQVATVPGDFVLVLDDYHLIEAQPPDTARSIDKALTFILEHMPPQMHLVISTREDPNLPVARLRARGQLTELRAAELRFTADEGAEFINQMMGQTLSTEDIAALENRTEGWIAGLQLAVLALQGSGTMQEDVDTKSFVKSFTGSHHFVMDYLVEEVLQQQSESVQTFLLRTSILDRLCGPLCDAVCACGIPNSERTGVVAPAASEKATAGQITLEYMERANLFIFPLDNERHWFRYHHLFVDLLRQRLGQSHTPEEIAQFHRYASEWYEKNGDVAEAFHHLIAAREFNRAAAMAETSWQAMNESFQSGVWLGWVEQLPETLVRSRPELCIQIAWGFMNSGEVGASESRLQDAEQSIGESHDGILIGDVSHANELQARIAFARAYNAQTQRNFPAAMKYAEMVYKLIPEEGHYLRAQTAAVMGSTYWSNGDLESACRSMSDWIDRSREVGNLFFAIASASAKADIQVAQGKLREAIETYRQSLQLASDHENGLQRVTAKHYLGLAMLHHEMGNETAAAEFFQKSLVQGEQSVSADWTYVKCLAQARMKEAEGDWEAALDLLDEAQRFYVKSLIPYTRPIDAQKVRIDLKRGRLGKARDWAREGGLSIDGDLHYLHEFEHVTLALLLLAEYQSGRDDSALYDAKRLLERLLSAAEDGKRMGSVLEILVTQALVDQAQGSQTQAFVSLERALTLAQSEGYLRTFINEGDPMRLLLIAFRRVIEKQPDASSYALMGYIDLILAAFLTSGEMRQSKQVESQKRPAKDKLEDPLSHREVEVLRLITQGLSNREIGDRLFLALNTVKGYNQKIFSKLQVQSRTEAIARVRDLDLL